MNFLRIVASLTLFLLHTPIWSALPEQLLPARIDVQEQILEFLDPAAENFFPYSRGLLYVPFHLLFVFDIRTQQPKPISHILQEHHAQQCPFYFGLFYDNGSIHCAPSDESLQLPLSFLEMWPFIGYYKLYPSPNADTAYLTKLYLPEATIYVPKSHSGQSSQAPLDALPSQNILTESAASSLLSIPRTPSPDIISPTLPQPSANDTPPNPTKEEVNVIDNEESATEKEQEEDHSANTDVRTLPSHPVPKKSKKRNPGTLSQKNKEFFAECLKVFSQVARDPQQRITIQPTPKHAHNSSDATYKEYVQIKKMCAATVKRATRSAVEEIVEGIKHNYEIEIVRCLQEKNYSKALSYLKELSPDSDLYCFIFIEIMHHLPESETVHLNDIKKIVRKRAKKLFFTATTPLIDKVALCEYLLDDATDYDRSHYITYGAEHENFECLCLKLSDNIEKCPPNNPLCIPGSTDPCPHIVAINFLKENKTSGHTYFPAYVLRVTAFSSECHRMEKAIPSRLIAIEKYLRIAEEQSLLTADQLTHLRNLKDSLIGANNQGFNDIVYNSNPLINFITARDYWNAYTTSRNLNQTNLGFAKSFFQHTKKQLLAKQKAGEISPLERVALISTEQELIADRSLNKEEIDFLTHFLTEKPTEDQVTERLQGVARLSLFYHYFNNNNSSYAENLLTEGIALRSIDCIQEKISIRMEAVREPVTHLSYDEVNDYKETLLECLARAKTLTKEETLALFCQFKDVLKDILVDISPHLTKKNQQKAREEPLVILKRTIQKTPRCYLIDLMEELHKNPTSVREQLTLLEYIFNRATEIGTDNTKEQKRALGQCVSYLCQCCKASFDEIKKDATNSKEKKLYAAQELFLKQRLAEIKKPAAAAFSMEEVFAQTKECFRKKETSKK